MKLQKIRIQIEGKDVTARKLIVTSEIKIPLEKAWQKLVTSELLEFVAKGRIRFIPTTGKFPEIWEEGKTVATKMRVFGFFPFGRTHTLYFERIDDEQKVIQTREKDSSVKIWDHKMTMKASGPSSIFYEDEIIIYAGFLTLPISWWAASFYRYRQKRWQLLAKNEMERNEVL